MVKKTMSILTVIYIVLFFTILVSAIWLDYCSRKNEKLKSDYALLEKKYFKLKYEFSQLYKEKNKWAYEVTRLKEKEKNKWTY